MCVYTRSALCSGAYVFLGEGRAFSQLPSSIFLIPLLFSASYPNGFSLFLKLLHPSLYLLILFNKCAILAVSTLIHLHLYKQHAQQDVHTRMWHFVFRISQTKSVGGMTDI